MEPAPRLPLPGAQRTLAAIVFTDVVGFSARMQREEMRTLELLRRDFGVMRRMCAEHEGAVLKTTGDGLLMRFTSAVQAVACALAMQRYFAELARTAAAADCLQHRLGIHLGDVLIQDQDVMGDGVNIASRIQGKAEPGGICISQTVLDVVKNKLQLQVVSLGAPELKNISEAVPVYRLLLEAQALEAGSAAAATPRRPARSRRTVLLAGVVASAVLALAAALLIRSRARQSRVNPAPAAAGDAAVAVNRANERAGEAAATGGRRELRPQVREQYQAHLERYDFEALARELQGRAGENAERPGLQLLARSAEQMRATREWVAAALRRHSRARPLQVRNLSGGLQARPVFIGPDNRLHFLRGMGPAGADWTDLEPAMLGSIIVAALQEPGAAPPRDVVVGAQAFARIYNLPLMQEALAAARPRREKG